MRTVTFKSVLHGAATRAGMDPVNDLNPAAAAALTEYINGLVKAAWEYFAWPVERVLTAEFTPAAQSIALVGNEIDEVFGVYERDPRTDKNPVRIPHKFEGDNLVVPVKYATAAVWVQYAKAEPVFTSTVFDATATYVSGDLIYWTADGEVYKANATTSAGEDPDDTPAKWDVVEFPAIFGEAVKEGSRGFDLQEEGQFLAGREKIGIMEALLDHEVIRVTGHQGQTTEFAVAVR